MYTNLESEHKKIKLIFWKLRIHIDGDCCSPQSSLYFALEKDNGIKALMWLPQATWVYFITDVPTESKMLPFSPFYYVCISELIA